jgi:hypothetical protein
MSAAWWGREASASLAPTLAEDGVRPRLLPVTRAAVSEAVRARIAAFTPLWTRRGPDDAGMALVRLFSEQLEPVLARLDRLPEKVLVDFLDMAGVAPLPAAPAKVLVEFEIAEDASQPVQVRKGFQVSARAGSELIVFETERALDGAPARIAEVHGVIDGARRALEPEDFLPFAERGRGELWIGLSARGGVPGPTLSLAVLLADEGGAPAPVSRGGIGMPPRAPSPQLEWEVMDGGAASAAEVVLDETQGLTRSGLVVLNLPRRWRAYAALESAEALRWLRLRIAHGAYRDPPRVRSLRINVARALAARTVRDEVLQPVAGDSHRFVLSQLPVLPGTLELEVDEGGTDTQPLRVAWHEASSLADAPADAKVYLLDPASGTVTFGDGVNGAAVPSGFRHVRAASYRVGGGAAGSVPAGAVATLLESTAFLDGVANAFPAQGGRDAESQADAVARGPLELRTRERAVTVADYELLARRAPGALVARAHAVAGLDPAAPGLPLPGVVAVFVVPPAPEEGPPTPDAEALAAVATHLTQQAAPAGVEVIAAAPRYHRVRAEAGIVVAASANPGETVSSAMNALDAYLDPLVGGEDMAGWPFGGTIVYANALRRLTQVEGVAAVHHLNFVVDGLRIAACRDHAILAHALLWPEGHEVVIVEASAP